LLQNFRRTNIPCCSSAGFHLKKIQIALGFNMSKIDACLISHSHKDHSKAAKDLLQQCVDVYASGGTIETCGIWGHHRAHAIKALQTFIIGSFTILPFDVQHDAKEPLGFLLTSRKTGEKLLFFTDTYYIKYRFQGLTHIMAECNYDEESVQKSIAAGYIPIDLVPRLVKSHMSLEHLLDMLKANDLSSVRQIYLMHLSRNNSNADKYKGDVARATGAEVYIC